MNPEEAVVQPDQEPEVEPVEAVEEVTPEVAETETPEPEAATAGEEAPETPEVPEPEDVDETPQVEPESDVNERLKTLAAEVEKANSRMGYFQRKYEALETRLTRQPSTADLKEPQQEDYETFEEFQQAHNGFQIQVGIQEHQQQQAIRNQQESLYGFIEETREKGQEKYSDYAEVALSDNVPITQPMMQIMQGMDNPESMTYYLGKNVNETVAISRMSPVQQARALARIEFKVQSEFNANPTGQPASAAAAPVKPVTNAPVPIKPTKSANIIQKDPEKMNQQEYEAWRESGGGGSL